jgi:hypothetical protein
MSCSRITARNGYIWAKDRSESGADRWASHWVIQLNPETRRPKSEDGGNSGKRHRSPREGKSL